MTQAEGFVRRFAAFWAAPDPGKLDGLLTDDVRLVQPLSPPTHGIDEARGAFRRLLGALPELRATVDRWSGDDQHVFIEFRLRAPVGGSALEWAAVDRFTLRGDKASERVSYFDPLPLMGTLLWHPLLAWRLLRA